MKLFSFEEDRISTLKKRKKKNNTDNQHVQIINV